MHGRPGDGGHALRPEAGGRGDPAVVHVRLDGQRVRPRRGKPVFVDIRPDTLNIDENLIEEAITERTRVIFPVHYAGVGCEMDRIMAIARKHGLLVVEDAAQGVNSFYDGRALGSIGDLGAYSFHETKNYISGEGGRCASIGPTLVERAEIIRDKGTNRQKFFRGLVDKYTWVDVGSSYVPSEICRRLSLRPARDDGPDLRPPPRDLPVLRRQLKPLEAEGLLQLPHMPEDCAANYHMFYILCQGRPDARRA